MKNEAKSNKTKQADYKERQRKAGLVQITVWVPKDKRAELAEFVASLK